MTPGQWFDQGVTVLGRAAHNSYKALLAARSVGRSVHQETVSAALHSGHRYPKGSLAYASLVELSQPATRYGTGRNGLVRRSAENPQAREMTGQG